MARSVSPPSPELGLAGGVPSTSRRRQACAASSIPAPTHVHGRAEALQRASASSAIGRPMAGSALGWGHESTRTFAAAHGRGFRNAPRSDRRPSRSTTGRWGERRRGSWRGHARPRRGAPTFAHYPRHLGPRWARGPRSPRGKAPLMVSGCAFSLLRASARCGHGRPHGACPRTPNNTAVFNAPVELRAPDAPRASARRGQKV